MCSLLFLLRINGRSQKLLTRCSRCSCWPGLRLRVSRDVARTLREVFEASICPRGSTLPSGSFPAGIASATWLCERAVEHHLSRQPAARGRKRPSRPHVRMRRSSGSIDWRRILASKFRPPVREAAAPSGSRRAPSASSATLLGNWSVSQPSCSSPRFMSMRAEDAERAAPARSHARRCGRQASRGSARC